MRSRPVAFGTAEGPLSRTGAEELAAGSGPSAGCVGEAVVDLGRSAEAEAAPRAVVELTGKRSALALSERGQIDTFREILPEEPIGVFIGAAFPGVMGSGEVDGGAEALLERFVHVELGTVIRRDGVDGMEFVAHDVGRALQGFLRPDTRELTDAHETAFAFDHGDRGRLAAAVDGVDLPIAEAGALSDDRWPVGDHAFAGEAAAAVLARVAFPASLVGAAEPTPEGAAHRFVLPDVEVDRFDAHHARTFEPKATHDLFGAEVLSQHAFDRREMIGGVAPIPPGAAATAVRLLHREDRAVVAIVHTAVTLDLPPNRRGMPAEGGRNLLDRMSLASHRCDVVSFLSTQLLVIHQPEMVHLLPESKRPNKAPEPTTMAVTPRAIVRVIEMKLGNPNRHVARGAPATVVAHL